MDHNLKLKHTVDSLFGLGVSKFIPTNTTFELSKKTGRIKTVHYENKLLCTLRIDGGLAITPYFAQLLLKSKKFKENCLEVNDEAAPFIMEGRSVFCKHVIWSGKNIRIAADTPILFENKVIAVGRAVLSSEMISKFQKGVAVKVRDSLKSRSREVSS